MKKSIALTLLSVLVALYTSGCGYVKQTTTSEDELISRAAHTDAIGRLNLSIVPGTLHANVGSIDYQIKDSDGSIYKCQYNPVLGADGDTQCEVVEDHSEDYDRGLASDDDMPGSLELNKPIFPSTPKEPFGG